MQAGAAPLNRLALVFAPSLSLPYPGYVPMDSPSLNPWIPFTLLHSLQQQQTHVATYLLPCHAPTRLHDQPFPILSTYLSSPSRASSSFPDSVLPPHSFAPLPFPFTLSSPPQHHPWGLAPPCLIRHRETPICKLHRYLVNMPLWCICLRALSSPLWSAQQLDMPPFPPRCFATKH